MDGRQIQVTGVLLCTKLVLFVQGMCKILFLIHRISITETGRLNQIAVYSESQTKSININLV
jgi:hypothetical protein